MEQHSPILEVRRVTKRFPGVLALDGVSFDLRPGEVHALVGENGAGKSTLIKVVTGVYRPDEGEVLFNGEEVSFAEPRESQAAGISTIYQEINLIPLLSVAQNVFLGREPRNSLGMIDKARMNRDAAEILERYGIRADVTAPLRSLGLGVQQMVAIARAISVDARAVIMDEPTSSLEAREVETLFGVIGQLREEGVGVIYVTVEWRTPGNSPSSPACNLSPTCSAENSPRFRKRVPPASVGTTKPRGNPFSWRRASANARAYTRFPSTSIRAKLWDSPASSVPAEPRRPRRSSAPNRSIPGPSG
jgi:ABC-type branched-subunit amino acid transport system ATPase component